MDNNRNPNENGVNDASENWVDAVYHDPGIEIYRGNPYIESLEPDLLQDEKEVLKRLRNLPPYNPEDRLLPKRTRFHLIYNSNQFFRPLAIHLSLERDISIMIRSGYLGRNPTHKFYFKKVSEPLGEIEGEDKDKKTHTLLRSTATGFYMVGISGVGKSTAVWMILKTFYPPVIRHKIYKGNRFNKFQIVWLYVECPHDGSLTGLCKEILEAIDELLGTTYKRDYAEKGKPKLDDLIIAIRRLARLHGIGCLVIDEIHFLSVAKGQGTTNMLNFFVNLVNRVGMPVILVGTPKALPLLTAEFQQARRASGVGGDKKWYPMEKDKEWDFFVNALWKYQYVHQRQEGQIPDDISTALHFVSAGIVDFAIKAFILAQFRAIDNAEKPEEEKITKELIESVGKDSFAFAEHILEKFRKHEYKDLEDVPDIGLFDLDKHYSELINGNQEEVINSIIAYEEEIGNSEESIDQSKKNPGKTQVTRVKTTNAGISAGSNGNGRRKVKTNNTDDELLKTLETDDLRYIFLKGRKNGLPICDSLEKAQYVKDVTEFFYERG